MTNILFHMQKEIYKLKRRTHHVEQMLAKQIQSGHPIIRISRLTRDEISTICINNPENQQNIPSDISEEIENNSIPQPIITDDNESLNKQNDDTASSIICRTKSQSNIEINNHQQTQLNHKTKYCPTCQHEFSHRSAYLRHMRRIHKGIYPTTSDYSTLLENDMSHNETHVLTNDQSIISSEAENGMDNDTLQVLINQWDIGEGRLRPRRTSKLNNQPINKVKCDICNKFFRAGYIKRHKRRTHIIPQSTSSNDLNNISDEIKLNDDKPIEEIQTINDESPTTNTNSPSGITIAEMDTDDMPILFRKDSNKPIVIAVTCLERYQLDIIEEFVQKFPSRVCQTPTVDSRTTHLITNDDQHLLRSPLSMKLIEAIAQHCYCVSYRWIIDCLKYDRIIDENSYEIEGDDTDYHPHGGPKRSRLIEKRHSLFENIRFMIKCTENNDIKMTNNRLQDLITTCGGEIITCVTQRLLEQFKIVVLCDKLYVSERRHNYDQCRSLGIHFVSSDWVLESILEYRQKPFSSYEETPL